MELKVFMELKELTIYIYIEHWDTYIEPELVKLPKIEAK